MHGFFRCKLPVEVVDVEVKITSMQGTHIFRSDRTMQVIKCTPWSRRLTPQPTIIKKIKTFLEVEGKMGPAPVPAPTPAAASQFRPPLPNTNPNIRKDNAAEKRKRAVPKRFRPLAPKATAACPPLPEAPPMPKNDVPDTAMACFRLLRSGYGGTIRKSYAYTIWKRSYCIVLFSIIMVCALYFNSHILLCLCITLLVILYIISNKRV